MTHLDDEQALGFLRHQLDGDERAQVERHIDACADCRQLLSALAEVVTAETGGEELDDAAPSAPRVGEVIGGRFTLEGIIGQGGMGTVFRAHDAAAGAGGGEGATVAIKVMRVDSGGAARFEREARVLSSVRHPAVVRYLAHGRSVSGEAFLAMEWLQGEDLGQRLQRGPLTLAEALALVRRIAEGLAVAHEAGIVHRDVKPTNLFLRDGEVARATILDFGIARSARPETQATRRGVLLGTPGYMAPEQARSTREVDARADVFSLGCVFYECLTGVRAFAGTDLLEVLARVLLETPPPVSSRVPQLPAKLDALVQSMLAKSPDHRPRDCRALLEQLDEVERAPRMPPRRGRSRLLPAAVLSLAVVGLGALGASALRARSHSVAPPNELPTSATPLDGAAAADAGQRVTPVLVLDFENRTVDPLFDQILPEALEYALNRSVALEPVTGGDLRQLAEDLGQVAGTPLPLDDTLGKALATHDGGKVVMVRGDVTPDGSGYRLQIAASDAATGMQLLRTSRTAASTGEVRATIGALAWDLRRALGEAGPADAEDAVATDLSPSLEADSELLVGERLLYSGRIDEGLLHVKHATELDPSSAVIHGTYGGILASMRRPEAQKELETALAGDAKISRKEHLLFAGMYHYLRSDDEVAKRELDELIAMRPHALTPRYVETSLYERDGERARALDMSRQIESLHPRDPTSLANVVYGELLATDLARASADGERLVKSFPRLGTLAGSVAVVRALEGQVDPSRAAWQLVAQEDATLAALGEGDLSAFVGDWSDARSRLRAATHALGAKSAASTTPIAAETWSALADVEAHEGDPRAAVAAAQRALAPTATAGTLYRTARLLVRLGHDASPATIAAVQARLERDPSKVARLDARLLAAEVALARKDDAEVARQLQAALKIDDLERVHEALGRAALSCGALRRGRHRAADERRPAR